MDRISYEQVTMCVKLYQVIVWVFNTSHVISGFLEVIASLCPGPSIHNTYMYMALMPGAFYTQYVHVTAARIGRNPAF